jgi:hypothetical protein
MFLDLFYDFIEAMLLVVGGVTLIDSEMSKGDFVNLEICQLSPL